MRLVVDPAELHRPAARLSDVAAAVTDLRPEVHRLGADPAWWGEPLLAEAVRELTDALDRSLAGAAAAVAALARGLGEAAATYRSVDRGAVP